MHRYLTGALALVLATPALAQTAGQEDAENERSSTENAPIIVTAARTQLPASALPLTVDVIDVTFFLAH